MISHGRQPRLGPGRLGWALLLTAMLGGGLLWAQGPGNAPGGAAPAAAPGSAAAPAAAAPAPSTGTLGLDPTTGRLPTLLELFKTSIVINSIILALSVLAVLMFIYFTVSITSHAMAPPTFIDDVTKLILNQQYKESADLCRSRHDVFVASIIQRCVENAGKGHSVIMDMLDAEGRRRADILWNRISYLADVSNVAPMLGLLGTVLGMIKAFFTLPHQSKSLSATVLAGGIGEAMSTTMFGLIVAIMALAFYSVVKARATKALAEAEYAVHAIADHIKRGSA